MELQNKIESYKKIRERIQAYYYLMNIVSWDAATIAPVESYVERGNYLGLLSEDLYKLRTGEQFTGLVDFLAEHKQNLDPDFAHEIELIKETFVGIINQVADSVAYENGFIQKENKRSSWEDEQNEQARYYNRYGY